MLANANMLSGLGGMWIVYLLLFFAAVVGLVALFATVWCVLILFGRQSWSVDCYWLASGMTVACSIIMEAATFLVMRSEELDLARVILRLVGIGMLLIAFFVAWRGHKMEWAGIGDSDV